MGMQYCIKSLLHVSQLYTRLVIFLQWYSDRSKVLKLDTVPTSNWNKWEKMVHQACRPAHQVSAFFLVLSFSSQGSLQYFFSNSLGWLIILFFAELMHGEKLTWLINKQQSPYKHGVQLNTGSTRPSLK